ncbi:MAG: hypothetical protein OSB70_19005 [Myxococcota bacterium]|nr:hypothetical protein [Myxococcota bacterium]
MAGVKNCTTKLSPSLRPKLPTKPSLKPGPHAKKGLVAKLDADQYLADAVGPPSAANG